MTPRRMKQFLIEERCVFSGNMALLPVDLFEKFQDALKFYRGLKE